MPEDSSPTTPQNTPLDHGLVHHERLRLGTSPIDALPDPELRDQLDTENERFLRGLAAMEEHVEPGEDGEGLHPELARLDLKVSLLMDLVGELLSRQAGLPSPEPVRFNGEGIAWASRDTLPEGRLVALELYLHGGLPRPLHLFARVVAARPAGEGFELTGEFLGLSETVRDLIEKHVFRAHRRQVARHRARTSR